MNNCKIDKTMTKNIKNAILLDKTEEGMLNNLAIYRKNREDIGGS